MYDHKQAAFYPFTVKQRQQQLDMFHGLNKFVDQYLTDSEKLKVGTEHF